MGALPDDLKMLLGRLDRRFKDLYGDRYRGLVLYGSYARGEADEGSDVDLLLLLEGGVNQGREILRIEHVNWPISLEANLVFSILPVSVEDYRSSAEPFMLNVRREGVPAA